MSSTSVSKLSIIENKHEKLFSYTMISISSRYTLVSTDLPVVQAVQVRQEVPEIE